MKTSLLIILTVFWLTITTHGQNPLIQSVIGLVRADSIQATLEHLQDFGTRYALADNRKEIATWIMSKFSSYGYTDVKLDSFRVAYTDSTYWQYNVICTMTGNTSPEEVCIIGGHYDSFCNTHPDSLAPGADDNASGAAATLEAARVMKLMNYQPESTIRFILFAAEEQGLLGSKYQGKKSWESGEDIRLMVSLDMIANNPDSLKKIYLLKYKYTESVFTIASGVFQQYTNLSVFPGSIDFEARSDSYSYWLYGFHSTWAFEYDFSPYYHTVNDVISNCNIEYCAEITRGVIATIMEMQFLPFPQGIVAHSSADYITINWKPTGNSHLKGYKIYRSENDSAGFVQLNSALITDTFYVDQSVETKKDYHYFVKLINDSLLESVASNTVHGARFGFTDTLLVVACLKDTQTTPDSITQFYASVLDSIPFRWFDMNKDHPITLATLSQYRNTLWVINSLEYDRITDQLTGDLETFFANHGNMMFTGFSFTRFMLGNIGLPLKSPENSIVRNYFRIDSTSKKISSLIYRAYPDEEGYDTLRVDTHKTFKPGYPGELYNIEVFTLTPGGNPIYRFDSKYDPGTTQGSQQDKIVGLEYMEGDFKTILLSFPLYYLDTLDAHQLMNYVVNNKFVNPLGIPGTKDTWRLTLQVFPNPTTGFINISLPDNFSRGILSLFNLSGHELLKQTISGPKTVIDISNLNTGIYVIKVVGERSVRVGKIVKE